MAIGARAGATAASADVEPEKRKPAAGVTAKRLTAGLVGVGWSDMLGVRF